MSENLRKLIEWVENDNADALNAMLDYGEDVDDECASILESTHDDLDAAKLLTDYRWNSKELPRSSESECPYCGKTSIFGIRGNRFNTLIMCSCCGMIRKA